MFTEEQLKAFADELGGLWSGLEQDVTGRICGHIGDIGKLTATDAHALSQLSMLGADMNEIQRDIARTLALSEQEVTRLYEEVARADYEFQTGVFEKLGKPVIPFAQNTFLQGLIADVAAVTNGEIRNMTRTTGFTNRFGQWEQLAKVYQDTVDYAILQVRSGVVDYHSAMRGAVNNLADQGLQCVEGTTYVEYANEGKRYYRRRLDSSVKNAFSGGMQRLSRAQNERLGQEFGADGMEVTFHRGARPTHVPMGGRQYPMKRYEREVVPLLMENNCHHRAYPIVLGISPPTYTPGDLDAINAKDAEKHTFEGKEYNFYEAQQIQRKLETSIRQQKDRAVAAGKAGDKQAEQTALIRGAALNQKYAQFSNATGLSYKSTRVTAGLNRSQAARLGAQTRRLNAAKSGASRQSLYSDLSPERIKKLHEPGRLITSEKDLKAGLLEFQKHVDNMEEPYKSVFGYYAKNTDLISDQMQMSPIGYLPSKDALMYNDRFFRLPKYQFNSNMTFTHELAHRYDTLSVNSWRNQGFTSAINEAMQKVSANPEKYNALFQSVQNSSPAFQDILSALSDNKIRTQYGHAVWKNNQVVTQEIFANLSYLNSNHIDIPEFDGLLSDISSAFLTIFKGTV